MTILSVETQDDFLGDCWQMVLHQRNSTVTCRSTWPRQPLRWGNGIMIKPSALTLPPERYWHMNIIQGYTRPLLQPIFFCGGRGMFLLEAGWMCVTWSANMFKPTNVQQNSHLGVRTTEIGSPQKKETVLDDFKATKNFNDKMCDYISCNTPCRITLSVPTQAKPWKVCGPRPPNGADACRDPNQRPWPAVNHMNWRQVMVSWSNVQRFGEWKKYV